ncbi:MAG: molecular chaperone HtpG, partial [Sarcina sp.]|nr:molecular chaperone HtpG [Sarcina sp.]
PEEKRLKIRRRPMLCNDPSPLWAKTPKDCTDEEYKEFYRKVFNDYREPLFWIHLNMDYPFNLKGILYFPRLNLEYESAEGVIKLYNSQVFIADNIREVIPEFLMLLKGVIDCPDLPLNVSRSALQNDGFAQKISDYISKKVAEKLAGMCKTDKENYDKYWDDISPFIKYGCLKDEKFCEKMTDYILFKDLDGKYHTMPDALEINTKDADKAEEDAADGSAAAAPAGEDTAGTATDENGNAVEADVVGGEAPAGEDGADKEEDRERTIYYVTNPDQQSQYIRMFRENGMQAFVLDQPIDTPFIAHLESKNEGIHFARIDADVQDALRADAEADAEGTKEKNKENEEKIAKIVQKALEDDKLTVRLETLKDANISSMLTVDEQTRRYMDMMKVYAGDGLGFGSAGLGNEGRTLILNAVHPLVKYVLEHEEGDNTKLVCEQLYDLAVLQNEPLTGDEMAEFVSRSNKILMLLVGENEEKA